MRFDWFWAVVILGIWMIISPFVLGYSGEVTAMWNAIIVGIVLVLVGLYGTYVGVGRGARL